MCKDKICNCVCKCNEIQLNWNSTYLLIWFLFLFSGGNLCKQSVHIKEDLARKRINVYVDFFFVWCVCTTKRKREKKRIFFLELFKRMWTVELWSTSHTHSYHTIHRVCLCICVLVCVFVTEWLNEWVCVCECLCMHIYIYICTRQN